MNIFKKIRKNEEKLKEISKIVADIQADNRLMLFNLGDMVVEFNPALEGVDKGGRRYRVIGYDRDYSYDKEGYVRFAYNKLKLLDVETWRVKVDYETNYKKAQLQTGKTL